MQQILHYHHQERPPNHRVLDTDVSHYKLKLQCTPLVREKRKEELSVIMQSTAIKHLVYISMKTNIPRTQTVESCIFGKTCNENSRLSYQLN